MLVILFLITQSCIENDDPKIPKFTDGEATLSTEHKDSTIEYFSFKNGIRRIPLFNPEILESDLTAMVRTHESGRILGIEISGPVYSQFNPFTLLYHSSNMDSSEEFFEKFYNLRDNEFESDGIYANIGDVWAVRTNDSKLGAILIKDTVYFRDTTDTANESYDGYVTFKWKYFPDTKIK